MSSAISSRSLVIVSAPIASATVPRGFWIARAITSITGCGLRAAGRCSLRGRRHLRRLGYGRTLRGWCSRRPPAAHRPLEGHRMFTWGVIVFVGLWLILADLGAVRKAKLMGNPILVHVVVIGSGLWIHGGSADGAMAAIVSGVFSALYVRVHQRWYGFIRKNVWHPGVLRAADPPLGVKP